MLAGATYQPIIIGILALIVLLVVVGSYVEQPKTERYFEGLNNNRKGISICEFAREFDTGTTDTWIIRAVYEQLQNALPTKQEVPIKASDHLFEVLMLDEEDLDLDLVEEISQRTGRSLENYENNPYYGKVTTARNLVLFFNHQVVANAT